MSKMAFSGEVNYVLKATEYFITCSSNVFPERTNSGCAKRIKKKKSNSTIIIYQQMNYIKFSSNQNGEKNALLPSDQNNNISQ